jgi:hypothetical protein
LADCHGIAAPLSGAARPRRRRAFEIAFSCCYVFAGSRPHFLAVDEVTFRRPVDIGTLLQARPCAEC